MKVKVTKVNGNNNNFVLLFKNDLPKKYLLSTDFIKNMCKSNNVDGLLVVEYFNYKKINLDYYNNDGTWETLCINGTRCAALIIYKKYKYKLLSIKCGDGIHKTKIINDKVTVSMPEPKYIMSEIKIDNLKGHYINSGAKHFVLKIDTEWPKKEQLISIAKKIRYNKKLFPEGINVNFYKIIDYSTIKVITYEKGVEDIVQSCASGSYACAYHLSKKSFSPNFIVLNNGGNLFIKFSSSFKQNSLTAKAMIDGVFTINL